MHVTQFVYIYHSHYRFTEICFDLHKHIDVSHATMLPNEHDVVDDSMEYRRRVDAFGIDESNY